MMINFQTPPITPRVRSIGHHAWSQTALATRRVLILSPRIVYHLKVHSTSSDPITLGSAS
jgi:hypothetical protein